MTQSVDLLQTIQNQGSVNADRLASVEASVEQFNSQLVEAMNAAAMVSCGVNGSAQFTPLTDHTHPILQCVSALKITSCQ